MSTFEVRDMRHKEKFFVDDEYLNGYAKLCGINATGVYFVLCRHADKNQECFPSMESIAEKLGIGKRTVVRAINTLVDWNIIGRGDRKRHKNGKWMHNTYHLLDKSVWKSKPSATVASGSQVPENTQPSAKYDTSQVPHRHTKDTHKKDTHIRSVETSSTQAFSLKKYIDACYQNKNRHVQLIGLYMDYKIGRLSKTIKTKEQASAAVRRHLKSAKELMAWSDEQLNTALAELNKNADYDWTLESVYKHLTK